MSEPNSKEPIVHKDIIGRVLEVDDCVAVSHHNGLKIGRISKINPKMVKVHFVKEKSSWVSNNGYNKYPSDCAKLEGPELTSFLLQNR